jgi:hypothetical protein
MGKDVEGSNNAYCKVLSQYLPGGIAENYKSLSQDSQCPSQDSNWAPLNTSYHLNQSTWYYSLSFSYSTVLRQSY